MNNNMNQPMQSSAGRATVDYTTLKDNALLFEMTEARTLNVRREAYQEYKRRLAVASADTSVSDEDSFHQTNHRNSRLDNSIILPERNRVFVIPTSKIEMVIYDETKCMLHTYNPNHPSAFRGSLEALLYTLRKCGTDNNIYMNCDYINKTIRHNIEKWKSNGYMRTNGREAKNKDLLERLVRANIDFNNVMALSDNHRPIIDHVKRMYDERISCNVLESLASLSIDETTRQHMQTERSIPNNVTIQTPFIQLQQDRVVQQMQQIPYISLSQLLEMTRATQCIEHSQHLYQRNYYHQGYPIRQVECYEEQIIIHTLP